MGERLRAVFMGTPDFAVPSLEALAAAHEVALVLTRPDAVRGRGRTPVPSPVKACALELGLPVLEVGRVTPEVTERVAACGADVGCVAAFGCILPDDLLAAPAAGCVNVHASLLPRWRGAAPVQRAILAGDAQTGVSIMRVGHGVDTGAYCAQAVTPIGEKNTGELTAELARLGADLLVKTLPSVVGGTAPWVEQDEALVTHAAKVEKAELLLDPAAPARENALRVQASGDTAPARCVVAGRGVRVCAARAAGGAGLAAGEVRVAHGRVLLGCADGALEALLVKPDGKRQMEARAWASGLRGDGLAWGRVA
ncbi:methionyl-tRNA formyltransferase [Thermophilibacter sp.]